MVFVSWIRWKDGGAKGALLSVHQAWSLGLHVNKLGVDKSDGLSIGHSFGIQVKYTHKRRYLVLINPAIRC